MKNNELVTMRENQNKLPSGLFVGKVIVCGDMVEDSKPNPSIYLKACNALEEDPISCYALEDSQR